MTVYRIAILGVVALGLCLAGSTVPAQGEQEAIPLQQAVKEGKVEVQVSSLGGATGKTIRVDVRRKVGQTVHVEITPGTVLLSESGKVQNMAAGAVKGEFVGPNTYRPTDVNVFVLADNAWHGYLVESFCMDFHKGPPQRGERFNLTIQDQRAARIIEAAKEPSASVWAFQFALWMDREGISEKELLSRYGNVATEVDVRVARNLVQEAEQTGVATIPQDMPADVRVEVNKLFSPDPTVRASAVEVLVNMGGRAESAAPFLASNVTTETPGQLSGSTWLKILTNPQETTVLLEQAGLPDIKAILEGIRERRKSRLAEDENQPNGNHRRPLLDRLLQKKEPAAEPAQP